MSHHAPIIYAQAFVRAQHGKLEKEKETLLGRLIAALKENGDEKKIPATLRAILKALAREESRSSVRVVTAAPLSAQQKNTIEKQFPASAHQWEVNPEILGGIMVEQRTRLYQMTVRHLLKGFNK